MIDHDRPCARHRHPDRPPLVTGCRTAPARPSPSTRARHPGRWRWYSPANAPRPDGTIELHVRAVPAGTVSASLVNEVRPGDLLHLGPPRDTGLHLRDGDLLLVAGGTGLAPLRALVEQVAAAPDGRRVTLIAGRPHLRRPVRRDHPRHSSSSAHDWLTIVPAFSHDPQAAPAEHGDALTLARHHHRPHHRVYVCGPPAMLHDARRQLPLAGVPVDRLHLPEPPRRTKTHR